MIRTNIHLISFIKKKCVAKQWAKIRKKIGTVFVCGPFFYLRYIIAPCFFLK